MPIIEIIVIICAVALVVGVTIWSIIRKVQGKGCLDCDCSCCSGACYKAKLKNKTKGEDNMNKDKCSCKDVCECTPENNCGCLDNEDKCSCGDTCKCTPENNCGCKK